MKASQVYLIQLGFRKIYYILQIDFQNHSIVAQKRDKMKKKNKEEGLMTQGNKCYPILRIRNRNQINSYHHQVHQEQITKRRSNRIYSKIILQIRDHQ